MRANRSESATSRGTPPVADLPDRACAGTDPKIFYPEGGGNSAATKAKAICNRCPHVDPCLEWALATEQRFGVWGAASAEEREQMLKEAS